MNSFSTKKLLEVAYVHFGNLPILLDNYDCTPKATDLDAVFGEVCRRLEVFESANAELRKENAALREANKILKQWSKT